MKRFFLILTLIVVLVVFGWTMFFLYGKSKEKPVKYNTEKAEVTDIVQKTMATGSIVPRREILIKPVVSGIIADIYVVAGEKVEEGDLIAKIRVIPNMVSLNEAEARLERAKIAVENAKVEWERSKQLKEKGVIADSEFLPVDLQYKNAQAELEAAEENLQIVKEGVSKKAGSSANTLVRSTIDGMVLDVPIKKGTSVIEANNFNEGTTIATVADMSDLIFEGKVDEAEVGKIDEGMPLILTVGALPDKSFDAELEYISPKGVEENGAIQFEIRAAVQLQSDQFLRAGYSANADIVLARADSVLAIDEGLVQFENDTPYVEVLAGDQQFTRKNVELGLSDGIKVEIKDGLKKDEEIKVWNKPVDPDKEHTHTAG